MGCGHYLALALGADKEGTTGAAYEAAFTIESSRVTFGRGSIAELGDRCRARGMRRVGLFTDPRVVALPIIAMARAALAAAGVDVALFDQCRVEPTAPSLEEAARFAASGAFDGFVSVGGGSVIDTAKAANLLATHPAPLLDYVNAPVGAGRAVPGPLRPHIACPTTSGTGSEVTGIAIFDLPSLHAKTGIADPALRPTEAIVDPAATDTLPGAVVASSGMDVLAHALESYTARPYVRRPRAALRPMSQGANPHSDVGCREALELLGRHLVRAVRDASDIEARTEVMWAATLAGIAFGNAGVHVPHAMAYAVAGLAHKGTFFPDGYPKDEPMVPHGMSVVVNAPAVFRLSAPTSPERHLEAAALLGGDVRGASPNDAGAVLSKTLDRLLKETGMPSCLSALGYRTADVADLVAGTLPQKRLLSNAPIPIGESELSALFSAAMVGPST
jgi:hydroxyacid-oxoacid transhydrogenase